ncbi:NADP-dependent 3-hydroxy acid dehydrogenase YdfG [Mesobacillus persicus]|uniref:NADP-dependent 3-hydroxy acid dehydrogenase YdfG n=1 Tax=Mesobacillus persicus TaxID=930146 RepID=A0A1H7WAE8_9BACI|nr:oxidoreductase [Mesobacillus persicus]SEM18572.1 NADP-dependent 3-hydroxy acid dehydrogenase YdfG [Mesobacillus persicus]
MSQKTAIVTGSSSGFGLLIVLALAKKGFHVIATMRDPSKASLLLEEAQKLNVVERIRVEPLDVTMKESITNFKLVLAELSSIDVLVNNAGKAMGGFCEELSVEDYREQFETNFFGVIAVTQAVLPFMRGQGSGRIINISSISGRVGFPGLSPYTASKHALEGFSESLRLEVKPFGIDVVLIEPGSYKTNIWTGMDQVDTKEQSPYYSFMRSLKKQIESEKPNHGDPEAVASLVAQVASQKNTPDLRYPIGKGVKTNIHLKNLLPWKTLESIILKKLL